MSSTCQELMHACREAEHSEPDGKDLKKVQDHIKKMAGLFKALTDANAQKVTVQLSE
jgi:hypothetical protein